jgi:hypothetical protein
MIRHLLHWADAEYWGQSWPNIFAPSVWTRGAAAAAQSRGHEAARVEHGKRKRGSVKWLSILWQLVRDVMLTGYGMWVIWSQVQRPDPNGTLLAVALVCIAPAARSAVTTVLSGAGSSSESSHPPAEPPSASLHASSSEGTDEPG